MKAKEIYISETPSTNTLVKSYLQEGNLKDFTLVYTDHQTSGRGQMGSNWISEKGKNIACSLFKEFEGVKIRDQFIISMMVALSIVDALEALMIPKVKIKWPNDIYSANKKVSGILIETTMSGMEVSSAIIGMGINVNQVNFDGLPNANSLLLISGRTIDRSHLIHLILEKFSHRFDQISKGYAYFQKEYEKRLYRKDKVSLFKGDQIGTVNGIIKGINEKGQLLIDIDHRGVMSFNLKEVQLLTSN